MDGLDRDVNVVQQLRVELDRVARREEDHDLQQGRNNRHKLNRRDAEGTRKNSGVYGRQSVGPRKKATPALQVKSKEPKEHEHSPLAFLLAFFLRKVKRRRKRLSAGTTQ